MLILAGKLPFVDLSQAWQVPENYLMPVAGLEVGPLEDWKRAALLKKFKSLRE